jgi:hypothetical protein
MAQSDWLLTGQDFPVLPMYVQYAIFFALSGNKHRKL